MAAVAVGTTFLDDDDDDDELAKTHEYNTAHM